MLAFLAFVVRYQSSGGSEAPSEAHRSRRVIPQEEVDLLAAMDEGADFGSPKRKPASDPDPLLEDALAGLPGEVVRAKGFFREAASGRTWIFHLVCGRVETTPFDAVGLAGDGLQGRSEEHTSELQSH